MTMAEASSRMAMMESKDLSLQLEEDVDSVCRERERERVECIEQKNASFSLRFASRNQLISAIFASA